MERAIIATILRITPKLKVFFDTIELSLDKVSHWRSISPLKEGLQPPGDVKLQMGH